LARGFRSQHEKPLLRLHPGIETPGRKLAAFIRTNGIKVLNIAGSRLPVSPGSRISLHPPECSQTAGISYGLSCRSEAQHRHVWSG
jgi:hypothetical protein